MSNLSSTLVNAGFDPSSAAVFVYLTENGEQGVPAIQAATGLSRAGVYDALNLMIVREFVETRKEGRNAYYKALHPNKLLGLVDERKREANLLAKEMEETVNQLTASFNISSARPGVLVYEGKEKIIGAYDDLLDLRQPIDSIEDAGDMSTFIPEYFPEFIKKRVERNIYNRVVAPATNQINVTSEKEKRETRTIAATEYPFTSDIKICGNRVLIVTLKKEGAIAVRIDDQLIATNFRLLFKFLWNHAERRASTEGPRVISDSATVFNT